MAGRELHPVEVLEELFEEMLILDAAGLAKIVLERLRDAGFVVVDWKMAPK